MSLKQKDFVSLLLHSLIHKLINHCLDEKVNPRELSMDLSKYDFYDYEDEPKESAEQIKKTIETIREAGFDTNIFPEIRKVTCTDVNSYPRETRSGKREPTIITSIYGLSIRTILIAIYDNHHEKAKFYDNEGFTIKDMTLAIKVGWQW